jgi:hypothetical protein
LAATALRRAVTLGIIVSPPHYNIVDGLDFPQAADGNATFRKIQNKITVFKVPWAPNFHGFNVLWFDIKFRQCLPNLINRAFWEAQ